MGKMLEEQIHKIHQSFDLDKDSLNAEELRIKYLGKKSAFMALYGELRNVAADQKAAVGQMLNSFRSQLESAIETRQSEAAAQNLERTLSESRHDLSLPALVKKGSLHPVSLMRDEMIDAFHRLGFVVYDGPEIDDDFHNFSALNFPANHPARDMQDTFFLESGDLLRTHTSNVQIHAMLQEKTPS
jgi:phenylalanyl-tRNA synthetase alpha chain